MGRLVDQCDRACASPKARHFLQIMVVDVIDGEPLRFGLRCKAVPAKDAESHFAGSHPIDRLLVLAAQHDVHFAEEAPNELRTQLWMVIEITELARPKARIARIKADDFSFPLWLKEIPIGFKLGGLRKLRIVSD